MSDALMAVCDLVLIRKDESPFALLAAVLGPQLDAGAERVRFLCPRLPDFLDEAELRNLRLGSGALDVLLHRRGSSVAVTVLSKSGSVSVEVVL